MRDGTHPATLPHVSRSRSYVTVMGLAALLIAAGLAALELRPEPARAAAQAQSLAHARALGAESLSRLRAGDPEGALRVHREAIQTAQAVGPDVPGRNALLLGLRRDLHGSALAELQRQQQERSPDWALCARMAGLAAEVAPHPEARAEVLASAARYARELEDEARYARAVEVVEARDLDRYAEAVTLLWQIDPASRISPDAGGYLGWIRADLKTREADEAYRAGEGARAFLLLQEALREEVLGPQARQSIETRHDRWLRVVTAWRRVEQMQASGAVQGIRSSLEQILRLEQDPHNDYRRRAEAVLAGLDR